MLTITAADYARIFSDEREQAYPVIDAFEQACGHAVDRDRLETAARVLACPLKANPPNWQHGRVLYAALSHYCDTVGDSGVPNGAINVLDIGTAKGFSALCLRWAMTDAQRDGQITSVDVIDPHGTERRNTVAEIDGPVTLFDILTPWPESQAIHFLQSKGIDYLKSTNGRIHVAFVDGKHDGMVVTREARMIAARQNSGDLIIFDDAHIPGIAAAIEPMGQIYELERLEPKPGRAYVIARRR